MSLSHLGLLAAFAAGIVCFISPCGFPLVPGYISYLAGTTLQDAQEKGARWRVSLHALCFVLGFTIIFVLLGATASLFGTILNANRLLLARLAGFLLIIFGLVLTGLVPLPFLSAEHRMHVGRGKPAFLRSVLVGLTFGAGWSPCVGPVLASILALTATGTTLMQGVTFLLVYALGLGTPYLLVGLFIDRVQPVVHAIRRYTGPICTIGGAILVLTGMLILTGHLAQLASLGPAFNF